MGKVSHINSSSIYKSAPKASAAVPGVLVDPPQTTDDIVEKVTESSPAFSLLASRCTTESEFSELTNIKVYSFAFALPHLVEVAENELWDDPRGAIVELLRTGVSFRNISKTELTLHANTPIAFQHTPEAIYARLSGFYRSAGKKKGQKMSDDCHLKPGQTVTFKINWKNLPNEYTPLMQAKESRLWMNLVNFAVEIKNINQETGAEFNDLSSMLSMIPKATYTKRQSNPIPPTGSTIAGMQGSENFVLQEMAGAGDLFSVYPISVQSGGKLAPGSRPLVSASGPHKVFELEGYEVSFIQSAVNEGDLFGVEVVPVSRDNYTSSNEGGKSVPASYSGTGLCVKIVGGHLRPLELKTYQGAGNRVVIVGFNVDGVLANSPISYSSYKWDQNTGYWMLWDDDYQVPRRAPEELIIMENFTPVSTRMPLMIVKGVYTKKEQLEMHKALLQRGQNDYGQPFGDPRGFGTFLKKAIGVLTVVGQVAGYLGTLL